MKNALLFAILLIAVFACKEKEYKNDEVNSVDRKGAIETELSVQKNDTLNILITKHRVWKNNNLVKEIITKDTLPTLGDTVSIVEDSQGYDQVANIKKEYEFYITVQ